MNDDDRMQLQADILSIKSNIQRLGEHKARVYTLKEDVKYSIIGLIVLTILVPTYLGLLNMSHLIPGPFKVVASFVAVGLLCCWAFLAYMFVANIIRLWEKLGER